MQISIDCFIHIKLKSNIIFIRVFWSTKTFIFHILQSRPHCYYRNNAAARYKSFSTIQYT